MPRLVVQQLGVTVDPGQRYQIVVYGGQVITLDAVQLDLVFLAGSFRGRYLVTEDRRGILGRDVLNHFALRLDGPKLQWAEAP